METSLLVQVVVLRKSHFQLNVAFTHSSFSYAPQQCSTTSEGTDVGISSATAPENTKGMDNPRRNKLPKQKNPTISAAKKPKVSDSRELLPAFLHPGVSWASHLLFLVFSSWGNHSVILCCPVLPGSSEVAQCCALPFRKGNVQAV